MSITAWTQARDPKRARADAIEAAARVAVDAWRGKAEQPLYLALFLLGVALDLELPKQE